MTHTSAAATRKTRRPRRDHHIITSLTGRARRETETREPRAREQTESERHERGWATARREMTCPMRREREREREKRERERNRDRGARKGSAPPSAEHSAARSAHERTGCVNAAHDAFVMIHEGACGRRAGCVKGGGQASVSAHRCGRGVGMLSAPGAHDWCAGIKARGNAPPACAQPARRGHGSERSRQRGARQRRRLRRPFFVCTHHDIRVTLQGRLSSASTTVSTNAFIFCFKGSPARSASHARRTASSAPAKPSSIAAISTEGRQPMQASVECYNRHWWARIAGIHERRTGAECVLL